MEPPRMHPEPQSHLLKHVGDRIRFTLSAPSPEREGWTAYLRTNLTRGARAREETLQLLGQKPHQRSTFAGASWRDIPMRPAGDGWELDLWLAEPGHFRAKAYARDPKGFQHWPHGADLGISIHADELRTANTIYCAFPRTFGPTRTLTAAADPGLEARWRAMEQEGLTVIPRSGTLRDLTHCVPHIAETLGCRILHLLPITPTPTVLAKMGRFGSPYASLDLTTIDPALVDFDQRTTAVEQFRELADAMHLRGGKVFLDIVVNHTGWHSRLMEEHPEWFQRNPDGTFHSPGAWGVTWGDLVELDNAHPELWDQVAEALLVWCRRGVDGYRCDAGYMVPLPAWQYILAKVQREFPRTVFLLEGLGGAWEATEALLTDGGMQWAYSELFQNFSPEAVSGYLEHALRQGARVGTLVHYSETHDNERLARRGAAWSLLRNRLCALASQSGAFAFTAGVEWLATEKLDVHETRGLNWDAEPNLLAALARLNRLISDHPCFFDGALVERLSAPTSPVLALRRRSGEGLDTCLVLVNLDAERPQAFPIAAPLWQDLGCPGLDLLDPEAPPVPTRADGSALFTLAPGESRCLAATLAPRGLAGEAYREARARAAWALESLAQVHPVEELGPCAWRDLAAHVQADPFAFLAALSHLDPDLLRRDAQAALARAPGDRYPNVVRWGAPDARRVLPVPPRHWILVEDGEPFSLSLRVPGRLDLHLTSIPAGGAHVAALPPGALPDPGPTGSDALLVFNPYGQSRGRLEGSLRLVPERPEFRIPRPEGLALLTNGRGAMARLHADLGAVASKYDCALGANLHPSAPCDRHILVKRLRAWVNADGFIAPLDRENLVGFEPGPPARWTFLASAGDGRRVELELEADLVPDRNTVVFRFARPARSLRAGTELARQRDVRVTVRLDLEDRGFHFETRFDPGLDAWFRRSCHELQDRSGFAFAPTADRLLRAWTDAGLYHAGPEWSACSHPVESSRGLTDRGDAFSPGWFDLPLPRGGHACLIACAEPGEPGQPCTPEPSSLDLFDTFGSQLHRASGAFLARRGEGLTVVAGYPWFLDWGRDTLIAARGLLAAGRGPEVRGILLTFARFEVQGTLPNMLNADSTANRDTSDAPLWFALACEEAAELLGPDLLAEDAGGRPLVEVLRAIARAHLEGCPNRVHVDPTSGLVWSPPHFTWMDTNYPACSPREGYPIELQALWIRLLRHLERLDPATAPWRAWADLATASLDRYWHEDLGWCADTLHAPFGTPAAQAIPDDHLRPNQLFAVALGLLRGTRARRVVDAAARHLLVPGALRSLAPLPVTHPLPCVGAAGQSLNAPGNPYWGRYEGDEDTRRKPAYHNGTAWTWLLATFCEALARAWDDQEDAVRAALAYAGSTAQPLVEGCLGHLPEILDGDAPHTQRGCDAQAWSATETLRAWQILRPKLRWSTPSTG